MITINETGDKELLKPIIKRLESRGFKYKFIQDTKYPIHLHEKKFKIKGSREDLRDYDGRLIWGNVTLHHDLFTMHLYVNFSYKLNVSHTRKYEKFIIALGNKYGFDEVEADSRSFLDIRIRVAWDVKSVTVLNHWLRIIEKFEKELKRFTDELLSSPRRRGVLKV